MDDESRDALLSTSERIDFLHLNLTHEELLKFAAGMLDSQKNDELEIEKLMALINPMMQALSILRFTLEKGNGDLGEAMLAMLAKNENAVAEGLLHMQKYQKKKQATNAASVRVQNDPKNKALKEIAIIYEAKKSDFKRHGYSALFSRQMHVKYPIFDSISTIERLVAKLNKSNELIPKR